MTDHPLLVESHILEDDVEDLWGKWLGLDFIKPVRSQQKFENESALTEQIAKDCEKAKQILTEQD